jgi:hypothetical protein
MRPPASPKPGIFDMPQYGSSSVMGLIRPYIPKEYTAASTLLQMCDGEISGGKIRKAAERGAMEMHENEPMPHYVLPLHKVV